MSKILGKVAVSQPAHYLAHQNAINAFQSGFQAGHSIKTAPSQVLNGTLMAKIQHCSSVFMLFDLPAALETLDPQIVLARLALLGVSGNASSWFSSYF